MMRLLRKKGLLGSAGLTLVELIISMAILAVVGTAIGGAMYVSSRSYTRGSAEVNVQEEAQVAANLICDWLVDATSVNPVDGSGDTLTIVHPEGDDSVTITITKVGDTLTYSADNTDTGAHSDGILASYVDGVTFTSSFKENRNVKISMDFKVGERTYHAVTDSTSRNHDFISTGGGASGGNPVIGFNIPPVAGAYYVILEPGQNDTHSAAFDFEATVYYSDPASTSLSVTGTSTDCSMSLSRVGSTNKWTVHCQATDNAKLGGTFTFTATGPAGTTPDTKDVTILVRRANKCDFSVSEAGLTSGTQGEAGSLYNPVSVDLGLQNKNRISAGAAYDSGSFGYKDPSLVEYYYRFADGSDASGAVIATEVTSGDNPTVQVALTTTISQDLYVIAVVPHSGKLTPGSGNLNTGTTALNKVTSISGTEFSYTGPSAGNQAYWDYFVIKKGTSGGTIDHVGAGFQRGSHAFRLGELNAQALNEVVTFMAANGGPSQFRHVVSFRYKKVGDPTYSDRMVLSVRNGNNGANDWTVWGTEGSRGRDYLTDLFDCDSAYTIEVFYDLIDINTCTSVKHYQNTGTLNACDPYVYNQNTGKFVKSQNAGDLGTSTNPVVVDKNHGIASSWGGTLNDFYVYFDSLNVINNDPYKIGDTTTRTVQKYTGPATRTASELNNSSNWTSYSIKEPTVQGSQSLSFGSTATIGYNTCSVIYFDGSTDPKYVGNFNQNSYPDVPVTVVSNSCGSYQHNENGLYRITYTTKTTGQRASITEKGRMPSIGDVEGESFKMVPYNITSPETLGTVYYEIKNF